MNNYNISSTGYNIEFNAFYDLDIARMRFNDDFDLVSSNSFSLLNPRYRGVNIYAHQLPCFDLFDLENWHIPAKKDLYNMILNHFYNNSISDFNLDTTCYFSKYSYQLTKSELLEFLADTYTPDYHDFIKDNFKPKFTIVSSRGHCQGDYAEIIYFKEDFNNNDNLNFDDDFWNAPIYARFEVNDHEFYIDERLKNSYSYDKEEFKKVINDLINESDIADKQLVIDELFAMLPSELEYK